MVSELVVNNNQMGRIVSDAVGGERESSTTGIVVVQVWEDDLVWIRTNNPLGDHEVQLSSYYPSTFSGWLLFESWGVCILTNFDH